MATAHFTRTAYKSGGQGRAAQRIQYITRTGPYSPVEARIRHQGLESGTERLREDLVQWEHANLPAWAADDPVYYFSAAERYEGANRVAYTEWRFSLPRELSRAQHVDAARDVLQAAFGARHPYVWALHDPPAADGGSQPHMHVLWSARTLDAHARTPDTYFKKYNRAHPERGGAEKAPDSYQFGSVKAARVLYTDVMNLHLERAGHAARLHPDRLRDRGFDRTPEPRLAPSDSNAFKFTHAITPAMQRVLAHRAARGLSAAVEQADAQRYWQQRRETLALDFTATPGERLACIAWAHHQTLTQPPARTSAAELARQVAHLSQEIAGLERYHRTLVKEHVLEQAYERTGRQRSPASAREVERVLDAGRQHGIAVEPVQHEVPQHQVQDLLAQVLEQTRDKGRDLGMGF